MRFVRKKKKYHCTENQNLNLNTERHRQTSLFLIIRLFGNLSDNFIYRGNFSWLSDPKVISNYLSIAFREKLMITVANMWLYYPWLPLTQGLTNCSKTFEVTPLYLYCRREKTIKGGNFLWRMKLKKLFSGNFARPLNDCFAF